MSVKFKASLMKVSLDFSENTFNREIRDVVIDAAQAFVTAVAGRVPVWSGMARASLFRLARLANTRVVLSSLRAPSRVPQGEALGEGEITATSFTFVTRVPHYVIQETRSTRPRGSPSAPWRSIEAGIAAAEDVIQKAKISAPRLNIRRRTIG